MSTVFAVERWAVFHKEAAPLFVEHWKEIALNHEDVPLDIAWDKYAALAKRALARSDCAP
jgi:hypothetical protein